MAQYVRILVRMPVHHAPDAAAAARSGVARHCGVGLCRLRCGRVVVVGCDARLGRCRARASRGAAARRDTRERRRVRPGRAGYSALVARRPSDTEGQIGSGRASVGRGCDSTGRLAWLADRRRATRASQRARPGRASAKPLADGSPPGVPVRVAFDQPVRAVVYTVGGNGRRVGRDAQRDLAGSACGDRFGRDLGAAREWERLGPPASVSWFPVSRVPVLIRPLNRARITPITPLRLTFSQPVAAVLGSVRPTLTPRARGRWRKVDSHTLLFVPAAPGVPFASELELGVRRRSPSVGAHGAHDPSDSLDRSTRLDPPAAATARRGRLPPTRLDSRRRRSPAHAAGAGSRGDRRACRPLPLALREHPSRAARPLEPRPSPTRSSGAP